MRYWKLKESNRVIAVSDEVEMTSRWTEISKEQYELYKEKTND